MVRNVDYAARRRAVLTATIDAYIREAEPVASEAVAQAFGLSSATIRNIFVELEQGGYLTHPYTSGGRIPTEKGYRYYVDFLISQMELLSEEKKRIVEEYRQKLSRLDDVLEKTSRVISQITHYAGMVSLLEEQDKLFYRGISYVLEQPEFQDYDRIRLLIRMIEEKQRLLEILNRDFTEPVKVYIGSELGCPEMANCSIVVTRFDMRNRPTGRIAVLGPARMEYGHIIPTVEYVSQVLSEALEQI